jgi:hypothetical protein
MSLMYECDKRYTKEILTRDMKSSWFSSYWFSVLTWKIKSQNNERAPNLRNSYIKNFLWGILFLQKNIKSLKVDKLLLIIDSTNRRKRKFFIIRIAMRGRYRTCPEK